MKLEYCKTCGRSLYLSSPDTCDGCGTMIPLGAALTALNIDATISQYREAVNRQRTRFKCAIDGALQAVASTRF